MKKYQAPPQGVFEVVTESFHGPLHLMLHLIKKHQLDLTALNFEVLTKQYLEYLTQMQKQSLDLASEYLHELSGLVELRSRKLLPETEVVEEEEVDQEALLVHRLQRYQSFQEVATQLAHLAQQRRQMYGREMSSEFLGLSTVTFSNQPTDLRRVYQRLMARKVLLELPEIEHSLEVVDYAQILEELKNKITLLSEETPFYDLCIKESAEAVSFSFITILQMSHHQTLHLQQAGEELLVKKK